MTDQAAPERQWRNRIIGSGEVDPEQLLANPANWRIHPLTQQREMQGVLDSIGWVRNVIVNQRTQFVVDGHMRVAVSLRNGETRIPVEYVDLDEDEEAAILATFDPIAGLAATDYGKLRSLINFSQDHGLDMETIASAFLRETKERDDVDEERKEIQGSFDEGATRAAMEKAYATSELRQIHLIMNNEEYETVVLQFRAIAEKHEMHTNNDVFMWLVAKYVERVEAQA